MSALATAAALAILFVLDRIGTPQAVLAAAAVGLVLALWAAAGAVSGTMRLKLWVTAGRGLGGEAATLVVAAATAVAWPGLPPAALAVGLALGGVVLLPALRRSGAPTLSAWLAAAHGSRAVGFVAAVFSAAVGVGLGASAFGLALLELMGRSGWPAQRCAAILAAVLAVGVIPGGLGGLLRCILALLAVFAACLVAALPQASFGLPGIGERLAASLAGPEALVAGMAVALGVMVLPPALAAAVAVASPRDVGPAWLRAAVLVALLAGIGILPVTGTRTSYAAEFLCFAGALAGAGACAYAAGMALAEIVGPAARRQVSLSRRFAWARLAGIAAIALIALAALHLPVRRVAMPAVALAAAALLPPALLLRSGLRSTVTGALCAMLGGAVTALIAVDGRFGLSGMGAGAAGVLGAVVGLALGAAVSLIPGPAADPGLRLDDDSL